MFWVLSLMIIMVMMAMLQVTPELPFAAIHGESGVAESTMTVAGYALLIMVLLSTVLGHWLTVRYAKTRLLLSTLSRSQHAKVGLVLYPTLMVIITALVLVTSACISGLAQYKVTIRSIDQPIRVQALATIVGLSDSIYDPELDSGYRQVVTLTQIVPLATSHSLQSSNNSLSKNNSKIPSVNQSVTNPWQSDGKENPSFPSVENNPTRWSDTVTLDQVSTKPLRVLVNLYPKPITTTNRVKNKSPPPNDQVDVNSLAPNQQVKMTLQLLPIKKLEGDEFSASTFDSERWLRSRHIDATATLLSLTADPLTDQKNHSLSSANMSILQSLRWRLRLHFLKGWSQLPYATQQARAVTLSLLSGDRGLIDMTTKQTYQLAGISHLLAISGSHVLFLAVILANMVSSSVDKIRPKLYLRFPRWQLRWSVMVVSAFLYAAFTGFDVPAARTAWMLVALGIIRFSLLPISSYKILMVLAIVLAWQDPFVLWQAGYWLSFIAVALLLIYERVWQPQALQKMTVASMPLTGFSAYKKRVLIKVLGLIKLQLWLFVALLPITLLLFGKVSLWGLLINLFAIGLYGLVIVPLNLLAGLCYLLSPKLADVIWSWVIELVELTHTSIQAIVALPILGHADNAWLYSAMTLGTLIIVLLIFLPWLLPKGLLARWSSLPALTLLVMILILPTDKEGESTLALYLLPTNNDYLSVILLEDRVTQLNWLIMADYRGAKEVGFIPLRSQQVSASIQQQLGVLGIDYLQGMVLQTATIDNQKFKSDKLMARQPTSSSLPLNNSLIAIAQSLTSKIPTGHLWQAGLVSTLLNSSEDQTLTVVGCDAGTEWHSQEQFQSPSLSIQALTGWPELNQHTLADCIIGIESQLPISIYRFNALDPNNPILITHTQTALGNADSLSQPLIGASILSKIPKNADDYHLLIIDASKHRHLGQVWQNMCFRIPSIDSRSPQRYIQPNDRATLIRHSRSYLTQTVISVLQPDLLINEAGEKVAVTSLP